MEDPEAPKEGGISLLGMAILSLLGVTLLLQGCQYVGNMEFWNEVNDGGQIEQ